MRVSYKRVVMTLGTVGFGFLLCAACNTIVLPGNIPADAPASIAAVIQDSSQFAQLGSEGLADVDPGEVMDDLANLSGCWGASYVSTFFGLPFTGYEVYHFDATTGEGHYACLQGSVALTEHTFTFTVVGNDRIQIRRQLSDGTDVEVDALVTLSGSELKIAYLSQDGNRLDGSLGDSDDERVALVFKAFDCP